MTKQSESQDEIDTGQPSLDRSDPTVFTSSAEGETANRAYWHSRTPQERLAALELMRQKAYGYDPATARLQRVLEITQHKKR
jgi:hypothetical protein